MERIAFIIGNTFIYWNSIVLTLSVAAAICVFLAAYLPRGNGTAAAVAVPMALVLSVILGRLVHWYFRPDGYTGFWAAMTDLTQGGYALLGAFLACGLTALLMKLLRLEPVLGRMLDAMSLGGCAGIALGRLACFFSAADRGQIIQRVRSLPFVYPVNNVVTGAPEYRLATFVIQSMATAAVFVLLLLFLLYRKRRNGDIALLFILLYGMSQAVLDSTRYDSMYMRSNGFISVVQICGAVAVVVISVWFSIRMVKARGFRLWYCAMWLAMLGMMAGAGYMEYFVQRHGDRAVFSYSIMTACLGGIAALALLAYFLSGISQEPEEGDWEDE